MRKLLNTLFVTTEDAYAALDGENLVVQRREAELGRFPLHILQGIYLFTYAGASPALMGKCAREGIDLVFLTPRGRFLARTCGMSRGNVLLRRTQYRMADDPVQSCRVASHLIFGKVGNARAVLNRALRDHAQRLEEEQFRSAAESLKGMLAQILSETDLDTLRGLEGAAATLYFSLFDQMILRNRDTFSYQGRSRRPPLDPVNALLSFVYTMLSSDCASALETVGLDAYVGFLHRDRPGRASLSLDLMEELRPCMADRFVLTLINDQIVSGGDFEWQENGAVLLTAEGRRRVSQEWQRRKQVTITHPYLKEKVPWGLIPYVQALLLSRYLRGDLDGYPPFLWK